jgi:flagellar M-ring protein FliF
VANAVQPGTGIERFGGDGPSGVLGHATVLARNAYGRFLAMSPGRRRGLGACALLVGAVCAGMFWYAGQTDWRTLFSGLDGKDVQQIAQELSAAGIPYQVTEDGGGVRVGADQMDKARMEIATKGMPQSGRMGFELFDKPNWVGSEFDEKVNYQRALEGELEHTIGTLSVVRSARVHLVLPKTSLFAAQQNEAKASVVLTLRRSTMPPEQVESIRSLVAGAVENLSAEQVTLVDADGRVNLNAPNKDAAAGDAERGLEGKLVAMLEPTAGMDNVRATVNVSYDEGSEEKTDEVYDPSKVATLTMQKSEQVTGQAPKVAGVPGTASNTPGAAAAGSVQAGAAKVPPLMEPDAKSKDASLPVYPQGSGQTGTVTEENGSYAVTRHLLHSEQGPGRVRRITAAVIVNDRMSSEGSGKLEHAVWKPRSPEEMRRLEQLARAAVGFDAARGDEVVIENVGFSSNLPELKLPAMQQMADEAGMLLHSQPGLMKTLSFAGLGFLVVMIVVRPLTKQVMKTLNEPLALSAGVAGTDGAVAAGLAQGTASGNSLGQPAARVPWRMDRGVRLTEAQDIHEGVSEFIRKEPAQSKRLLESWISEPVKERD